MPATPVITPAPTLLNIIGTLRRSTLRALCEEIAAQQGCSIYRCYTPTREALDDLVRSGEVLCWSTAKPLYVRAQDAQAVRDELKAGLLGAIRQRGQATPGKLKSVSLGGMVIAMDLMLELAQELIDEGKIANVGRKGQGRTKIYVSVGEVVQQDMNLGVAGQVLRYLKSQYDKNLFRDTASFIASKLKLVREEVNNALVHLEERGLIEVTVHENGFLRFYAFAANTMVIRQLEPRTRSVAQVAYTQAPVQAAVEEVAVPAEVPALVDDVRPAARPALPVVTSALRLASWDPRATTLPAAESLQSDTADTLAAGDNAWLPSPAMARSTQPMKYILFPFCTVERRRGTVETAAQEQAHKNYFTSRATPFYLHPGVLTQLIPDLLQPHSAHAWATGNHITLETTREPVPKQSGKAMKVSVRSRQITTPLSLATFSRSASAPAEAFPSPVKASSTVNWQLMPPHKQHKSEFQHTTQSVRPRNQNSPTHKAEAQAGAWHVLG